MSLIQLPKLSGNGDLVASSVGPVGFSKIESLKTCSINEENA